MKNALVFWDAKTRKLGEMPTNEPGLLVITMTTKSDDHYGCSKEANGCLEARVSRWHKAMPTLSSRLWEMKGQRLPFTQSLFSGTLEWRGGRKLGGRNDILRRVMRRMMMRRKAIILGISALILLKQTKLQLGLPSFRDITVTPHRTVCLFPLEAIFVQSIVKGSNLKKRSPLYRHSLHRSQQYLHSHPADLRQ